MSLALAFDILAKDKGAGKALKELGDDVDKTGQKAGKLGDAFKAGLAGIGVLAAGAGAALVAGLFESIDREASSDKLAAQLGLDPAESKRLGGIAGDLYADAYGESFEQVNEAVGSVVSSIDGMRNASDADLQAMTGRALDFATAFEVDVTRAAQVAGVVLKSGLAKDGEEAFDLLVTASQQVPTQLREDLLDATEEYSQFFGAMGYSGEQAFALLVDASAKGVYGIDKMGDAVKEFTIRSTDMSKLTGQAYEALGLDTEDMTNKLLAGGDSAQSATQQIIKGLLGIKDPGEQAAAAIALFGTPLEDLNVTEIPAFLESLAMAGGELENVEGAADRMGQALNDNAKTNIEGYKRKAQEVLVDFIGNKVIPMIERNKDTFVNLGITSGVVALEVTAALFRLGEGVLRGVALAVDGFGTGTAAAYDFAADVLFAMDKAIGWIPGWDDKFRIAGLQMEAFANITDRKTSEIADDLRGTADGAGAAAAAVDGLRHTISELRPKAAPISADTSDAKMGIQQIERYAQAGRVMPVSANTNAAREGIDQLVAYANNRRGTVIIDQKLGATVSVPGGGRITERASGGPLAAGQWSWVGEQGPELVRFDQASHVYSAPQSRQMAEGGAAGATAVHVTQHINASPEPQALARATVLGLRMAF